MQKNTANKRCELAGIKAMLQLLDVSGCLVSLDAGDSYQDVAEQIVERARYCGTRKNLYDLRRAAAIQNLETAQRKQATLCNAA